MAKDYLESAERVQIDYQRFYQSETAKNVLFYRNAVFSGVTSLLVLVGGIVSIVLETICVLEDRPKDTSVEYGDEGMVKEGVSVACNVWNKVTGENRASARFWMGKGLQGLVW